LTPSEVRKLAQEFKALGFKVTRLDIALDDYTKSISFLQVRNAIAKKFRVHFEEAEVLENYGKWGGFTIAMGSKHSDIRLIFYNKAAESRGVIDSHRFEARFRDERAKAAFEDWLSAPEELEASVLAGLVLGVVNFVKRDGKEKNISRLPELRWWKRFKEAVGACIRHSYQKLPTTLKRCKSWIQDDVIRNLALICQTIGVDRFLNWFLKELKMAPQRYNEQHKIRREVWRREWEEIVEASVLAV
jgi:DNA relaxase NicK